MDYQALATLIATYPGYDAGVPDADIQTWVNEEAVQRIADRINSDELYELIDGGEFTALSAEQQNEVWNILLLFAGSGVPTSASARARARMVALFGAGSNTINAVVAAITYQITRASASDVGAETINLGDIQYARTLI